MVGYYRVQDVAIRILKWPAAGFVDSRLSLIADGVVA